MKKFIAFVIIILIFCSFFLVYGDKEEKISIQADVGFDKIYKPFYTTPIFITMDNNYKDIEGEIQIEIPNDEGYGNEVTLYAIAINHPKDTQKKYTMNIPLSSYLLNVKLKVVEGKNVLLEKYIRIDRGISENSVLIGLLSDEADNLNYLSGLTLDSISNSTSTKIVKLKEEIFPESLDVLRNFDIIIINNFATSKLTKEQYNTLKKWTEAGGFLVIATGANGGKTLSAFQDDFIIGEKGNVLKVDGAALGKQVKSDFDKTLDILDLSIEDGILIEESDGFPLAQKLDKGQGAILFLSFDMGMEPIISWKLNKYFFQHLFQNTAPASLINFDIEAKTRGYNYSIESALKNIPNLPLPNYNIIIFIFIVYIILVAPISYIILKRMDKREYMWGVVPVLSIIFASLVYFIGFGTRITEPLMNTVSLAYFNEKGAYDTKSFIGIFTPNKTNLKIDDIDNIKIKPFMRSNYYGHSNSEKWDNKKVEAKFILSPKSSIEFYDVGVWGIKSFEIEINKTISGNILGNITYINSEYTGFIENNTDYDLEDCSLVTNNLYIKLGDIKKGEKLDIPKNQEESFNNRYELMDSLYEMSYRSGANVKGEELERRRLNNQKRNIIDYYFNYEREKIQGIKFIAWSKSPVIDDIPVNNKVLKRYDNTMLVADFNLKIQVGDIVELPFGYIEPIIVQDNLMSGHYDAYNNSLYGSGTVGVNFNIGHNIKPISIKLSFTKPSSNIKQYIWNFELDDWEEGELSSFTIDSGDLSKYLDKNKEIKLKFDIKDDGIGLPQISVKGSVD